MNESCDEVWEIRNRVNCMEAGDLGWDLRQEMIDLCDLVGTLAVQIDSLERRVNRTALDHEMGELSNRLKALAILLAGESPRLGD